MYDTIVNPLTNRKVSVHSRLGKSILKKYEKEFYKTHKRGGGLSFGVFGNKIAVSMQSKLAHRAEVPLRCASKLVGKYSLGTAHDLNDGNGFAGALKSAICFNYHITPHLKVFNYKLNTQGFEVGQNPLNINMLKDMQTFDAGDDEMREKIKQIYHDCWKPYARLYQFNSTKVEEPDLFNKYITGLYSLLIKNGEGAFCADIMKNATLRKDFDNYKNYTLPRACMSKVKIIIGHNKKTKPERWEILQCVDQVADVGNVPLGSHSITGCSTWSAIETKREALGIQQQQMQAQTQTQTQTQTQENKTGIPSKYLEFTLNYAPDSFEFNAKKYLQYIISKYTRIGVVVHPNGAIPNKENRVDEDIWKDFWIYGFEHANNDYSESIEIDTSDELDAAQGEVTNLISDVDIISQLKKYMKDGLNTCINKLKTYRPNFGTDNLMHIFKEDPAVVNTVKTAITGTTMTLAFPEMLPFIIIGIYAKYKIKKKFKEELNKVIDDRGTIIKDICIKAHAAGYNYGNFIMQKMAEVAHADPSIASYDIAVVRERLRAAEKARRRRSNISHDIFQETEHGAMTKSVVDEISEEIKKLESIQYDREKLDKITKGATTLDEYFHKNDERALVVLSPTQSEGNV